MIMVSVIIPFYNAKKYISESIESVISQTYKNWELLLIDDGSTDEGVAVIQKYLNNPKIKLYRKENGGQASARNLGIRRARGKLVAFLDADDLWKPQKLTEQIPLFNQDFDLVFSNASVIDEKGSFIGEDLNPGSGSYFGESAFSGLMYGRFFIPTLTVVCKKEIIECANGFSESRAIQLAEDFDLWERLFLIGAKAYGMKECTAYYRKHAEQSSGTDYSNPLQVVEALLSIRKDTPKYSWKITQGIISRIRSFYNSSQQSDKKEKATRYLIKTFNQNRFPHLIIIGFFGLEVYFKILEFFLNFIKRISLTINKLILKNIFQ